MNLQSVPLGETFKGSDSISETIPSRIPVETKHLLFRSLFSKMNGVDRLKIHPNHMT